ncbi:PIH1 domain-containing protein 2 [Pseudolycoriella hygida]|uniref:PIH1 domain-containing protein 2 n=1 Tax=Pseudolycoriella hygida TaxID=35572 RepID=A0A9Q0N209_9DIPT|nr:PIH1 domain-containing protein 2 [Pseudolycoriella hygida]
MSSSPSHSATKISTNNGAAGPQSHDEDKEMSKYLMEPQDRPLIIRTSRTFKHFKNPPQPHMCIRDHTIDGQELFINVMSWTRIVMPQNSDDPIPLYGGMKVLPGTPRSPPLVYAVMANPDFLKHVGRNCPDIEEKRVLIELMCDFVEAMNPGLKLAREAEVLKDRDLSGELKDIWGAVQAQREREKDGPGTDTTAAPSYENYLAAQKQVTYIEFGPEFSTEQSAQVAQQPESPYQPQPIQQPIPNDESSNDLNKSSPSSAINLTNKSINGKSNKDKVNSNNKEAEDQLDGAENSKEISSNVQSSADSKPVKPIEAEANITPNKKAKSSCDASPIKSPTPPLNANTNSVTVNNAVTPPPSVKKEKLGGFLPNGCHNIFPFIKSKNNHSKKDGKEKKMKNVIDFVSNSKIEISNKMQTDNESGFKDDANVDKMQKLKL